MRQFSLLKQKVKIIFERRLSDLNVHVRQLVVAVLGLEIPDQVLDGVNDKLRLYKDHPLQLLSLARTILQHPARGMQELQRSAPLVLVHDHLGGLSVKVPEEGMGSRAKLSQPLARFLFRIFFDLMLPHHAIWSSRYLHSALLRQPLEHGVADRLLLTHVRKQPLVLDYR